MQRARHSHHLDGAQSDDERDGGVSGDEDEATTVIPDDTLKDLPGNTFHDYAFEHACYHNMGRARERERDAIEIDVNMTWSQSEGDGQSTANRGYTLAQDVADVPRIGAREMALREREAKKLNNKRGGGS